MEDENPLFAIEVSSSDEDTPSTTEKVPRDFQSEESFQTVKREWRARIECGHLDKTLPPLPLNPYSKPQTQQYLYAIEELYFYRAYKEALGIVERVLEQGDLMADFRETMERYGMRCKERMSKRDVEGKDAKREVEENFGGEC